MRGHCTYGNMVLKSVSPSKAALGRTARINPSDDLMDFWSRPKLLRVRDACAFQTSFQIVRKLARRPHATHVGFRNLEVERLFEALNKLDDLQPHGSSSYLIILNRGVLENSRRKSGVPT